MDSSCFFSTVDDNIWFEDLKVHPSKLPLINQVCAITVVSLKSWSKKVSFPA